MPRRSKITSSRSDKILKEIYYDPSNSGSFGGISRLHKAVKADGRLNLSQHQIKKWLYSQDNYTTHAPAFLNFTRRKVYASVINEFFDADLAELPGRFPKANEGVRYLLVVVDVLSRYLFVEPLVRRGATDIINAFEKIFKKESRVCSRLRTDKAGEFLSNELARYMKSRGIIHYITNSEKKASFAERAIRVLKSKIYRYINLKGSYKYIHILDKIVKGYNSSYNRTIQTSPDQVTNENDHLIWERTYFKTLCKKENRLKRYKFKPGDKCRVSYHRDTFPKGFKQTFSEEIFVIHKRLKTYPITYILKDLKEEKIQEGRFYDKELQKVTSGPDATYKVEKILKERQNRGKTQYLIKFEGYPHKFNQWVDSDWVVDL